MREIREKRERVRDARVYIEKREREKCERLERKERERGESLERKERDICKSFIDVLY